MADRVRTTLLPAWVLATTLSWAAPARGDATIAAQVVGAGSCPNRAAVAREVLRAAAGVTLADASTVIRYEDRGPRYLVRVGGRQREFLDPERRCDERARAVSVFAALVLEVRPSPGAPVTGEPAATAARGPRTSTVRAPAALPPAPAPPAPTASPATVEAHAPARPRREAQPSRAPEQVGPVDLAAAARPSPRRSDRRAIDERLSSVHVDLDLSGTVGSAPFAAGETMTGGLSARAGVMVGPVGVALGVGGFSPVRIDVQGGSARILHFPADLDLRLALRTGRVEGAVDLGVAVNTLDATGEGFLQIYRGQGAGPGFRLAAMVRLWFDRIYLLPSVEMVVGPGQPLTVSDAVVGVAPSFWLLAGVGVGVRLR